MCELTGRLRSEQLEMLLKWSGGDLLQMPTPIYGFRYNKRKDENALGLSVRLLNMLLESCSSVALAPRGFGHICAANADGVKRQSLFTQFSMDLALLHNIGVLWPLAH